MGTRPPASVEVTPVLQQVLLEGEDSDTVDVGEVRHWIRVYSQAWKTARRAGLLSAAHRFRRRLEYWVARHAELVQAPHRAS